MPNISVAALKSQAHRLNSWAKKSPVLAQRLADGQLAACYEAVAAVHGARNWSTMCALAMPDGLPSEQEQVQAACELRRQDTITWNAVINFVLDRNTEMPMEYLRLWREGRFDVCKKEWPEAPAQCYPSASGT